VYARGGLIVVAWLGVLDHEEFQLIEQLGPAGGSLLLAQAGQRLVEEREEPVPLEDLVRRLF
jgi:hypothetical protein